MCYCLSRYSFGVVALAKSRRTVMICDEEYIVQIGVFQNQSGFDVLAWPDGQRESYCRKMFHLRRQNRCCRGFTLVELLVVISVIALLLAILMPSLQKARQTAQRLVCSSNMRQIVFGLYSILFGTGFAL